VGLELIAISLIRYRYFDTPLWRSVAMVGLGGAIVFGAGILIGAA
jgi:hypothetical protein